MASASAEERREQLKAVWQQASTCVRCPQLAATRNQVVFGAGNADADLMFVGEAPGKNEDEQGVPFVGQAGKLLDQLLEEVGLARADVFIANVLKCRPPGNRDPHPVEIENCQDYLFAQVDLIRPKVVCTLGNFATKLVRADPTGITRIHGQTEVRVIGKRAVRLFPLFHPAAALYTRSNIDLLREDFRKLPELLAMAEPDQPEALETLIDPEPPRAVPGLDPEPEAQAEPEPEAEPAAEPEVVAEDGSDDPEQLGLF